jgi:chromosome partitioning protein
MTVIAVTARKGGVGKSTITGNLAAELYELGYSIHVLDADPQQSLCKWARLGESFLSVVSEPADTTHPQRFRDLVAASQSKAQVVLIDCPPAYADAALLAALVADIVLIPCGPSPLDIMEAKDTLELMNEARKTRGGKKPLIRFVPSKMISRAGLSNDLPKALADLGEKVLPGLTQRTVIAEATIEGKTIPEYAPRSPAQVELLALANAVKELIK